MHTARVLKGDRRNLVLKKKLRRELTPAERKLWSALSGQQMVCLKFRRQHGVGPYILDFYCPERRLAVEVDGDVHAFPGKDILDRRREQYLGTLGIQVVRYMNNDVLENFDGVVDDLYGKLISTSPSSPPYKGGEGP